MPMPDTPAYSPDPRYAASARLSVAPMMDWTDRHCRVFHRLLAPHARLYTEMVHANAVVLGDRERLLGFDPVEQPVALQLGGSEPALLAQAARIGGEWGYAEINLNCGCPSDRVQAGRFGACLMREPALVAEGVAAMRAATPVPVTVKCRLGVDDDQDYERFLAFIDTVAAAGCATFVVHARNAWLQGLSPKENREVPPLRYEWAWQLKRDRPGLQTLPTTVKGVRGLMRTLKEGGYTGILGNYLKGSIRNAGMDPDNLPQSDPSKMNFGTAGGDARAAKAWKDIWGCGQGIGAIKQVMPAAELIARLKREYAEARQRLAL